MVAELGSLCLVSTTADLELRLNSYAQLTASNPDFTIEELVNKALGSQSTAKPWISQGSTFKLIVSLNLEGIDVEPGSMTQAFSQQLYHSEMWSQLCLEPISMTISCNTIVTIQFSPSTGSTHPGPGRMRIHKLSDGHSCSAVQFYSDVPILELSGVHLAFRINQKQEIRRHATSQLNPRDELESFKSDTAVVHPSITNGSSDPRYSNRSHSTSKLGQYDCPHSQHELLAVLDAGIRFAITISPTRLAKGIRLDASESFKTLAEFAPAVWSPGYLTAMTSRSLFLPTISHALSQVGIRNAKSRTLKGKLTEVIRRASNPSTCYPRVSTSPDLRQIQAAETSIGSRLWQLLQITVFVSNAACRLKALDPTSDDTCSVGQNDLLDMETSVHAKDSEEGYDLNSDRFMIDNGDSEYVSEDDILSMGASLRSSSPETGHGGEEGLWCPEVCDTITIAGGNHVDEEMLCM